MQQREKILAGALAGALVIWFGSSFLTERIFKPLQTLADQEVSLTKEKNTLFAHMLDVARKDSQVKGWRAQSLPPDPLDAQRLYAEWLTTLAELSGFQISKVTLDARRAESNTFVTIPITIAAKARLQSLAAFLVRFESVELLHRISRCEISSPSNEGDPELAITLTAEGLSLPSAPARTRLFPLTELAEPITRDSQHITVVSSKGFSSPLPFCIRIGKEFLNVTKIEGETWTVTRGVEKTFAESHATSAGVEEFPLRAGKSVAEAALAISSRSLFTKPSLQVKYEPKLASPTPPVAIRGKDWSWKLEVSGWNPAFGTPKFELLAAPAGMTFDSRTSTLNWRVSSESELGNPPIEMLVWGTNGREAGFTASVNLRVRDPNEPPRFDKQEPLKFFIGRESTVQIRAVDPDGDPKKLVYSVSNAPTGMTIDASTGVLKWAPADSLAPQELAIKIDVKDGDEMPETASLQVSVKLEEDSARFTYLTGSVTRTTGIEEGWIYDRATNQRSIVHRGDNLRVADFDLLIEEIGPTYLLVRQKDKMYRWQFEQPLTQMTPLTIAARPEEPRKSEAASPVTPAESTATPPDRAPDTPAPATPAPANPSGAAAVSEAPAAPRATPSSSAPETSEGTAPTASSATPESPSTGTNPSPEAGK